MAARAGPEAGVLVNDETRLHAIVIAAMVTTRCRGAGTAEDHDRLVCEPLVDDRFGGTWRFSGEGADRWRRRESTGRSGSPATPRRVVRPGLRPRRGGTDTGFNGWFIADLSPTVALDISGDRTDDGRPNRTSSDSWKHAHVPVERPVPVEAHDRIVLSLTRLAASGNDIRAFAQLYTWQGTVQRATR
jgi:hypothetical protein